jgi:hypothetical protein
VQLTTFPISISGILLSCRFKTSITGFAGTSEDPVMDWTRNTAPLAVIWFPSRFKDRSVRLVSSILPANIGANASLNKALAREIVLWYPVGYNETVNPVTDHNLYVPEYPLYLGFARFALRFGN